MTIANRNLTQSGALWLATALLLGASLAPGLAWMWVEHRAPSASIDQASAVWFSMALALALVGAPLALFGRARPALGLLAPAAALAPFETFYVLAFGQPSGAHVYGVIAETHLDELQGWAGPYLVWAIAGWLAYLLLLGWACRVWWRRAWRWRHRSRMWALGALGALGLLLAALAWADAQLPDLRDSELQASESHLDDPTGVAARVERSYPWGVPMRLARFAHHVQASHARAHAMRHKNLGVRWLSAPGAVAGPAGAAPQARAAAREVHVLVIGETARPDRWGVYGAARDTTPRLMARQGLIAFTDAVSGAAATRESVPMILTAHRAADAPSLPGAFRQAGFRTDFLSNQGAAGTHETPVAVLARESDGVQFVNAVDYRGRGALDGELLPRLRAVLARNAPRQFIVLHTLGSHLNYAHRYPGEFERFKPALQPEQTPNVWNAEQSELLRNAYDNSVLYTDWLLDQVIGELQALGAEATLTFVADHGETLFDGRCGRAGHGFPAEVNYRVPMLVWTSERWQAAHPQRQAALREARQRPVSALSTFATVTGHAGFTVAESGEFPDLGRTDDARRPQRDVTHFGNFDAQIRGRSCAGSLPPLVQRGASAD